MGKRKHDAPGRLTLKETSMLQFVEDACADMAAFACATILDDDVHECLQWMFERTAAEAIRDRELILCGIEADARRLSDTGAVSRWLDGADEHIRMISGEVNGPLFELLLHVAEHPDKDCADLFRYGAQLLGKLPFVGNGKKEKKKSHDSLHMLWHTAEHDNANILQRLREDDNAIAILNQTSADANLGRMTPVVPCGDMDLSKVRISQRFAVEQGVRDDGTTKIRCVDSCTESGLNPCTEASEHLSPDNLDCLAEVMKSCWGMFDEVPHILKVDVDSAFRRVPIAPWDRWAAHIAFKHLGSTFVSGHLAMPFGASSSVFAWDRVGAALVRIARVILKIPLLRYVDDLFTAERSQCVEHCMSCVVRLVRVLLGPTSVSEKKVSCGMPLEVLGIVVQADCEGIMFWPSEAKVSKWSAHIRAALDAKHVSNGECKKLAGRLSWSAQHVFRRLGRALLRPLYNPRRGTTWSWHIESSLQWWLRVLDMKLQQRVPWALPFCRPVQLFCDARGTPPRLAAVLFMSDGQSCYTDLVPPASLLTFFLDRRDSQICGLELCAIALGLCTFQQQCFGQALHVWSDNCGSENATRRGSAKAWDHNHIVHALWVKAASLRCHMIVDRVPTEVNIADLPSRTEYGLLDHIGSRFVQPHMDSMFWSSEAWDTVMLQTALA